MTQEQAIGRAELAIVDLIRTSAERCTFKEMAEAVLAAVGYETLSEAARRVVMAGSGAPSKLRPLFNAVDELKAALDLLPQELPGG